jgi:diguanylate cyclase (GGDEF)-like protein
MDAAPTDRDASVMNEADPTVPDRPSSLPPRTGRLLCWLLLAVLLAATGWATRFSLDSVAQRRAYVFETEATMLKLRLEEQLQPYQALSRILVGFFLASETVEQQEWQVFLRAQQLDRTLPHFERAWFAFDTSDTLAPHYLSQREQPQQRISEWIRSPAGPATAPGLNPRLPLLYLEPVLGEAAGMNVYPRNAAAIDRAYRFRDTVLAPDFALLPDLPGGFAYVSPFFRPHELAGSAQPALEGLLGVSLDMDGLLRRLLVGAPSGIGVEIHRGHRVDHGSLLLAAGPAPSVGSPGLQLSEQVEYATQPLTLRFHAPPDWKVSDIEHRGPLYVALSGLLISLLGFAIARSLENTRERAMAMAEQMTIELREINRALAEMATTDSLTGLSNRRAFFARLQAELPRVQRYHLPCALLLFDIDHFKQINDTYGHPAGDAVLRAVGSLLRQDRRATDIAARIGGEEFALLLPHTALAQAAQVAEQLRGKLRKQQHHEDGVEFHCTASFGVTATDGAESPEQVMRRVDAALYRAKAGGRDRVEVQQQEH